jgi:hypothetical protein
VALAPQASPAEKSDDGLSINGALQAAIGFAGVFPPSKGCGAARLHEFAIAFSNGQNHQ